MALSAVRSHGTRRGSHRVLTAALATGIVLLSGGAALVAAAPGATVPGAIVAVDIAATASGPFEKVRIDLRFAVPDHAVAGDQFHLALPPQLLAAGPGFEVVDAAGEPIALASTVGNVVTFTTTAYVDRHDKVIGSAFLEAGWDRRKVTAGAAVDLAFDADGTTFHDSVTVTGSLPDRSRPDAWQGWADERAEDSGGPTNALRWTVASPQTTPGSPAGTVAVVVTPGAGSSLSCDRVAVSESSRLDAFNEFAGRTAVPAARRTIACGPGQVTITVTGVAPSSWVVVVGRATVTDAALGEYTNSATITANGDTVTARGLATHSTAGGNGGGAARSSSGTVATTAAPVAVGGSGAAAAGPVAGVASSSDDGADGSGAVDDAVAAPSADLAGGDAVAAATAGADGVGDASASGSGSDAQLSAPGTGSPVSRSNGFQWRSLVFLAALAMIGAAVYLRRTRPGGPTRR